MQKKHLNDFVKEQQENKGKQKKIEEIILVITEKCNGYFYLSKIKPFQFFHTARNA